MANLSPRIRPKRVGWIYVVNHYVLLNTKYKTYWLHGFRRFVNVFPHYKEANDRPSWHGKVDPKGTVDTIYGGDHKKLLYTKCINYGSHRIFFKSFCL